MDNTDEMIDCPKCSGCGKVKRSVKKVRVFSDDPSKKWCPSCQAFLDRESFHKSPGNKLTGYCKKCQVKNNKKRYDKKSYEIVCVVCKEHKTVRFKTAKTCSQRCKSVLMNNAKRNKAYDSLPNELAESLRNEERSWLRKNGIY